MNDNDDDENLFELGSYWLADLPQRGSVAAQAFGTGWYELDQILKFYLGQFILLTGIPGHGKSTFLLNVLMKLAKEHGLCSFLYVPENEGYLYEKLKLLWGNDVAAFEDFAGKQCVVQSATPHDPWEPPHTIEWVLGRAEKAVKRQKCELVLIDPWNELEHAKPKDLLMTDYIRHCLMLIKQFCRSLDAIVVMVAHPTKIANERPCNLGDVEGSQNWFNKCDNGLIIHRDIGTNTAKLVSAKVREIGAGKLGACSFYVDPATGIFTPQYGSDCDVPR